MEKSISNLSTGKQKYSSLRNNDLGFIIINFSLEWEGSLPLLHDEYIQALLNQAKGRASFPLVLHINHVMCTVPIVSSVSEGVWLHHKHPKCSMCSTQDLHKAFSLPCFFIYASEMWTTALHHSSYLKLHISELHPSDTESITETIIPNKKWSLSALPHYHSLIPENFKGFQSILEYSQQMASLQCV